MWRSRSLGAMTIALAASLATPALAAEGCKLALLAEWPVNIENNRPIIQGAINGQRVGVLLDTGADVSLIQRAAAIRLKLVGYESGIRMFGLGGETRTAVTEVEEFRIGSLTRKNWRVLVAGERDLGTDITVILGDDFFERVDVEFDFPHRIMRLFRPVDCGNAALAYWAKGGAGQVALHSGTRISFDTKLNDARASAMLDTGAPYTAVSLPLATSVGVTRATPGAASSGCTGGLGKRDLEQWIAPFDRFAIGDEVIRDPRIYVADLWRYSVLTGTGSRLPQQLDNRPDIILGMDFLKSHRVLVSRTQRKLYFTYEAGLVFPAMPRIECMDAPEENGVQGRIAALDQAIKAEPSDAKLLVARATALHSRRDYARALSDIDSALKLDPSNDAAHLVRGRILAARKEYEDAIREYDRVIQRGFRHPRLHLARGSLWLSNADPVRALADYDRAAELDPLDRQPRLARAGLWAFGKDDAKAQAELDAMTAADPRNPESFLSAGAFWSERGQHDKAMAHYDKAVALDSGYLPSIASRGWAQYFAGRMEAAARDLAVILSADPTDQLPLFVYVARARSGGDAKAALEQAVAKLKGGSWPEPLYRFHLGRLDETALLAVARDAAPAKRKDQLCEAHYHLAQRALIAGDSSGARPYLHKARDECPRDFVEFFAAVEELRRLP